MNLMCLLASSLSSTTYIPVFKREWSELSDNVIQNTRLTDTGQHPLLHSKFGGQGWIRTTTAYAVCRFTAGSLTSSATCPV